MARLRTFTEVKKMHEGKILKGAKIACCKCDNTDEYYNFQGSVSTEHLPKEFSRMGWLVGKNERTDTCPACLAKLRGTKLPRTEEVHVTIASSPALDASSMVKLVEGYNALDKRFPPDTLTEAKIPDLPKPSFAPVLDDRPMDKTDRRLVFSRLNEIYVDEKTGYSGDWTDAKVAQDLGVPVSWIASVRDADFGPELNDTIRAKSFTDLQALGEKIERHIILIDKKIEQMQALDGKISDAMKVCNEAIDRFEELSKSLETEDKRVEDLLSAFNKDVAEFKKMFANLASLASPK